MLSVLAASTVPRTRASPSELASFISLSAAAATTSVKVAGSVSWTAGWLVAITASVAGASVAVASTDPVSSGAGVVFTDWVSSGTEVASVTGISVGTSGTTGS